MKERVPAVIELRSPFCNTYGGLVLIQRGAEYYLKMEDCSSDEYWGPLVLEEVGAFQILCRATPARNELGPPSVQDLQLAIERLNRIDFGPVIKALQETSRATEAAVGAVIKRLDELGPLVASLTAVAVEVGSWSRFKAHALALGVSFGAPPGGAVGDVPVVEVADLKADQVRVQHWSKDREWTTMYRIPKRVGSPSTTRRVK